MFLSCGILLLLLLSYINLPFFTITSKGQFNKQYQPILIIYRFSATISLTHARVAKAGLVLKNKYLSWLAGCACSSGG